ncbi:MAG: STAS domain-containing protein [Magnetospirillum sp.]|nr:STAS domain-containing protein [Magnetospirillum sp.]
MREDAMHATVETADDAAVVYLDGRLTFAENGAFRQVVEELQQVDHSQVVIDLSRLDFIDSAGLGMLLVARDLVAAHGGGVALRHAAGQVGRMLHLAKFGDFFAMDGGCAQV